MYRTVDYKAIVDELRERLLIVDEGKFPCAPFTQDRIRGRLADLLDADPQASMDAIIAKLDEKWRKEGLI